MHIVFADDIMFVSKAESLSPKLLLDAMSDFSNIFLTSTLVESRII